MRQPQNGASISHRLKCLFAQLSKVHHGTALAFDAENIGCWGALRNLFGGPYQEDITVDLLVNIEKFKIDREQTNLTKVTILSSTASLQSLTSSRHYIHYQVSTIPGLTM